MADLENFLRATAANSETAFRNQKRILSFAEYLEAFAAAPTRLGRNAAQYLLDAFDFYGTQEVPGIGGPISRFKLFDAPFDGGKRRLNGHEDVQNHVYAIVARFAATGRADRLIFLHGPNGSGKTTFLGLLFRALENYSTLDDGALFRFNWIFTERLEGKQHMGFGPERAELPAETLAYVDENLISCKIASELREPPVFLVPPPDRARLLDELAAALPSRAPHAERLKGAYLREGALSARNKAVYDALLNSYRGDWRKVIRHVQVERYFISRRFGVGAAVVEPQQSVDATVRPMSFEPGAALPAVLQGLQLVEVGGELVAGAGGIVEFSDMLKRPLEMSKYLLNTCEQGTVAVPGALIEINTVLLGSSNEKYLTAFKANPDFTSFKGRLELVRMGYMREWKKEREIYREYLAEVAGTRHVAPHVLDAAALWTILTRLRRPDAEQYAPEVQEVIKGLTPVQKARLYGEGQTPEGLNTDEKKLLLGAVAKLRDEHNESAAEFEGMPCAAYEGRRGVSSREVMTLLSDAAKLPGRRCLSPLAVFDAVRGLLKDRSVYDFLRLEADEGYQDAEGLTKAAEEEYHRWTLVEIYDSMELVAEKEFGRQVEEYFRHVRAYVSEEKLENPRTGRYEDPSTEVLEGVEKLLELKEPADSFRRNLVTKIAAFSLEHRGGRLDYTEIFPELFARLRASYYRQQQDALVALARYALVLGTEDDALVPRHERPRVERTFKNMRERYGYCDHCAREVLSFVLQRLGDDAAPGA